MPTTVTTQELHDFARRCKCTVAVFDDVGVHVVLNAAAAEDEDVALLAAWLGIGAIHRGFCTCVTRLERPDAVVPPPTDSDADGDPTTTLANPEYLCDHALVGCEWRRELDGADEPAFPEPARLDLVWGFFPDADVRRRCASRDFEQDTSVLLYARNALWRYAYFGAQKE